MSKKDYIAFAKELQPLLYERSQKERIMMVKIISNSLERAFSTFNREKFIKFLETEI